MEQSERPLFVETTIFIWRFTRPNKVKRRILRHLEEHDSITSTYVKAEYINTFLRVAVNIYNVVAESEDLDDALGQWEQRWGGQYRLGVRLLFAVIKGAVDKEEALRALREMIEVTILFWFDEMVREVTDATHCEAAQVRPCNGRAYEFSLQFPPDEAPDGLREFLERTRPLLQKLADDIAAHEERWKKVTAGERVKDGLSRLLAGQYNLGSAMWRALSDTIIALEAHDSNREIYTGNVKDFQPVCEAIGLPLKEEHPK